MTPIAAAASPDFRVPERHRRAGVAAQRRARGRLILAPAARGRGCGDPVRRPGRSDCALARS
jgi:hypothetical protein